MPLRDHGTDHRQQEGVPAVRVAVVNERDAAGRSRVGGHHLPELLVNFLMAVVASSAWGVEASAGQRGGGMLNQLAQCSMTRNTYVLDLIVACRNAL